MVGALWTAPYKANPRSGNAHGSVACPLGLPGAVAGARAGPLMPCPSTSAPSSCVPARARVVANGTIPTGPRQPYEVDTPNSRSGFVGMQAVSPLSSGEQEAGSMGQQEQSIKLQRQDYPRFVNFFRQAGPYIEGHRDKIFVIVIPGQVRPRPAAEKLYKMGHHAISRGTCRGVPLR